MSDIYDAIVVGCGIVGGTVARALTLYGMNVLAIDDGRPMSGTAPSGSHVKRSWISSMKTPVFDAALETLDKCWGVMEEQFCEDGNKTSTMFRVDTDVVREAPKLVATVSAVRYVGTSPYVITDQGDEHRARLLVVATGAWASQLLPGTRPVAKRGISFRVRGTVSPFIQTWAPYKQIVAHQHRDNEIWVGDGTAVLAANWKEERSVACRLRCMKALTREGVQPKPMRILTGNRPYLPGVSPEDPCFLRRIGPRAWVATGSGKSGTISGGWVSNRIIEACG